MLKYLMQLSRRASQQVYRKLHTLITAYCMARRSCLRRHPHTLSYNTFSTTHMSLFSMLATLENQQCRLAPAGSGHNTSYKL